MIVHLLLSIPLIIVTVMMHAFGLVALGRMLRHWMREDQSLHFGEMSFNVIWLMTMIVLALFALHGLEIVVYALFYFFVGAVKSFEIAVYFSTISYTTIGYTDNYLAPDWRLQAGIEGMNGMLLIGWSTAFFVTMVPRLRR